ncbi:MAG: hypothetical protein IPG50_11785 [Myxococcales bacterium]|nr:hypothetical protein [Myxococcales bacterium]
MNHSTHAASLESLDEALLAEVGGGNVLGVGIGLGVIAIGASVACGIAGDSGAGGSCAVVNDLSRRLADWVSSW